MLLVANDRDQALELALRLTFTEPNAELFLVELAEPFQMLRMETRPSFLLFAFSLIDARKILD